MDREEREPWHLSKSVPLSLLFAIIAQTVVIAGAWFSHTSDFESFREFTKVSLAAVQGSTDDRYRKSQAQSDLALRDERISRLAADIAGLEQAINQIDRSLDVKFEKLTDLIRERQPRREDK